MKIKLNNIKAVFIDIDNTLLDFDLAIINSLKTGFAKYNLGTYTDSVYETFTLINNSLWLSLEKKEISFEELKRIRFDRVFKELGINFSGKIFEQYFREQLHSIVFPIEGSVEILKYLKEKYLVVLASNGPQEQQVTRVKLGKMDKYVDYIFTSELIGYSKPSKEYFDKVFDILNKDNNKIERNECVMIGDSLTSDISGAKQAEMFTILFDKHQKFNEIPTSEVDVMVKKIIDIKTIL